MRGISVNKGLLLLSRNPLRELESYSEKRKGVPQEYGQSEGKVK